MILRRRSNEAQCSEIDDDFDSRSNRIREESFNLQFVASKTSLLAFHSTRSTRFRPKDILLRNACSNATRFTTIFLPRVTHRAIVFTTFHRPPPSLSALSSTFARLCASQVLFPPRSTVFWHGERNVSSYRWEFVGRNGEEWGGCCSSVTMRRRGRKKYLIEKQ